MGLSSVSQASPKPANMHQLYAWNALRGKSMSVRAKGKHILRSRGSVGTGPTKLAKLFTDNTGDIIAVV